MNQESKNLVREGGEDSDNGDDDLQIWRINNKEKKKFKKKWRNENIK